MKRIAYLLLALPLVFAGCSGEEVISPAGDGAGGESGDQLSSLDRAAIEADMAAQPELFADQTFEEAGEDELPFEDFTGSWEPPEMRPDYKPLHFFRHIDYREKTVYIVHDKQDTIEYARVRVTLKLRGTFNIIVGDRISDLSLRSHLDLIRKRLADVGHKRAVYVRRLQNGSDPAIVGAESDGRRGWQLAGISNKQISSPEHTANIRALRIQTRSGLDMMIEDPLELRRFPRGIPHAISGEPVKLTVWTRDPTDFVFLFTRWGRRPMMQVEPGVFEGGLMAPEGPRFFHFGVNALDQGTLIDPEAPYDSDFWCVLAAAALPPEPAPAE